MEKKRHPDQSEFEFTGKNEQTLPLGELLNGLEEEFDHEDDEEGL